MISSRRGFLGALAGAAASLVVPRKKTFFFGMGLPVELDPDRSLASVFFDGRRWARLSDRDAWVEVWTGRTVTGWQLFANELAPTDVNLDYLANVNDVVAGILLPNGDYLGAVRSIDDGKPILPGRRRRLGEDGETLGMLVLGRAYL